MARAQPPARGPAVFTSTADADHHLRAPRDPHARVGGAEREGRAALPSIRKEETLRAAKILGIGPVHFLDQKDAGFATEASGAESVWGHSSTRRPAYR